MEALLFRKKGHKTDIFPVLQKLTHMCDAHQKWRRTDKNLNSWSRRTNTIDHVNR